VLGLLPGCRRSSHGAAAGKQQAFLQEHQWCLQHKERQVAAWQEVAPGDVCCLTHMPAEARRGSGENVTSVTHVTDTVMAWSVASTMKSAAALLHPDPGKLMTIGAGLDKHVHETAHPHHTPATLRHRGHEAQMTWAAYRQTNTSSHAENT
jgi:membrane-associated PAP2 superfamily phosphatase